MSEPPAPEAAPNAQRWDLPSVEGAALPRPGAQGVNVMHLTLVEREAWQHGYKDGHVEGVRKGEAELAKRIGVTRQTLIAIEQGKYSPTLELAFQISRIFGVGLDDVFQYPSA